MMMAVIGATGSPARQKGRTAGTERGATYFSRTVQASTMSSIPMAPMNASTTSLVRRCSTVGEPVPAARGRNSG